MTPTDDWTDMLPLVSERLILRRFASKDREAFQAYRTDREVARYQGWEPPTPAEARRFIEEQAVQAIGEPGQWLQIAIAQRDTDQLAGDCALHVHADDERQATIGITLARSSQGRGVATEALTALFDHLFGKMALHRLQAETDPDNTASWSLLERLGMRREGHAIQSLWFKGGWADSYFYALLRDEWQERRFLG